MMADVESMLSSTEVCKIVGISKTTLSRRLTAGEFPRPMAKSGNNLKWHPGDIRDWVNKPKVRTKRSKLMYVPSDPLEEMDVEPLFEDATANLPAVIKPASREFKTKDGVTVKEGHELYSITHAESHNGVRYPVIKVGKANNISDATEIAQHWYSRLDIARAEALMQLEIVRAKIERDLAQAKIDVLVSGNFMSVTYV